MFSSADSPVGIPIPKYISSLPRPQPPVRRNTLNDLHALDIIENFGLELELPMEEIEKELDLASGPSDLVIILQRPARNHNYAISFEKFVQDCPTLKAVDELIRFATNGARSIRTVSVLDALMFKPGWRKRVSDERCHQLLGEVLRLKKPSVILQCHTEYYKDPWLQNHCLLPCEGYRMRWKTFMHDGETESTVIQSFHPSVAVNYKRHRPEYRILLLYHFARAFSHPQGTFFKIPRSFRGKCATKLYENNSREFAVTCYNLSKALDPKISSETIYREYYLGISGSTKYEQTIRDRDWCDSMYEYLVQLSDFPRQLGIFKISRAIYTWEEDFKEHPLYAQVIDLLFERGNEQKFWCEPEKKRKTENPRIIADELELAFSGMQLKDKEAHQDTLDQPTENNESQSPTDTQGIHGNDTGKIEKIQQEERIDWTYLHEKIQYAEQQCLVLQNPADLSLFNLSFSLRICRLVFWLQYQIQLLRNDEFKKEGLEKMVGEVEDFVKVSNELKILMEE